MTTSLPSSTVTSPVSRASYEYSILPFAWAPVGDPRSDPLNYVVGGGATILFLRAPVEPEVAGVATEAELVLGVASP
jgi:hypothetical protein